MIERLTPEQEARFPEFVERWTKIGLETAPADRPRAEAAIRKMYEIANLKPPKIVWCSSPLAMGLTRAFVQNLSKKIGDSVGDSVGGSIRASMNVMASIRDSVVASVWTSVRDSVVDSVRDSVGASVGASVWPSVRDSVGASVGASIRASARDSVWESVCTSVWANVGASIWASVGASVRASVRDSVWTSVRDSVVDSVRDSVGASVGASVRDSVVDSVRDSVYGQHDASWLAFYDFFREVTDLITQTNKLEGLLELARSANWALPYENICWVSERHCVVRQDDHKRIHCENGPAIMYPDGWSIYAWHGVRVPREWIEDKSITAEQALKQDNVELRRVACEIVGWDRILNDLDIKIINVDPDPQIGTLVEVNLPDAPRERFLRVLCGTGRTFVIPVPNHVQTALEANAWTYDIPTDLLKQKEHRT